MGGIGVCHADQESCPLQTLERLLLFCVIILWTVWYVTALQFKKYYKPEWTDIWAKMTEETSEAGYFEQENPEDIFCDDGPIVETDNENEQDAQSYAKAMAVRCE